MNITSIKEQLHQFIDTIEDEKVKAIYTLFEDEIDTDKQRKKLIQLERVKYLKGEGKSFTVAQIKAMALNKEQRHVL